MKFAFSAFITFVALFFSNSALAAAIPRSGTPMTQAAAAAKLKANGITAVSSGSCTDKTKRNCTSFDGMLSGTVDGVITLKKAAGVPSLVVTGGTETGHAKGVKSHATGHKIDLRHSAKLDTYIKNTFTKIGLRGDGFPQWRAASGNLYCDEGSHWDVTYL